MSSPGNRREAIRNLLAERGRLSVEELAPALGVTTMTIRRDLTAMEKAGVLTRTHGGCVLHSPFVREIPFSEKDQKQRAEKLAIAREAAGRLPQGSTVYLDTGTTAFQVARVLPDRHELRVLTNNLRVAMELFGRQGVEVLVYGGRLAPQSPDLVGEVAISRIGDFRIDVAVIGADALDPATGEFYSADMGTAMLSRTAQQQAERVFLVLDSSKLGMRGAAVAGRLGPRTTLITDSRIRKQDRSLLSAGEAEVVIARVKAGR